MDNIKHKRFTLCSDVGYLFRRGNGVIYFQKVFSNTAKRKVFRKSLNTTTPSVAQKMVKDMVEFFKDTELTVNDIEEYLNEVLHQKNNISNRKNKDSVNCNQCKSPVISKYIKKMTCSTKEKKFIEMVIYSFVKDNPITDNLFQRKMVEDYINNTKIKSIGTLYKFLYRLSQFTDYLIICKTITTPNYFNHYKKQVGKRRNYNIDDLDSVSKTDFINITSNDCYFYVQKLVSPNVVALKYGISYNPEIRMREQEKCSLFHHELIYKIYFNCRELAENLEYKIKNKFGGNFCKKSWISDGYTETLDYNLLNDILVYLEDFYAKSKLTTE